MITFSCSCGKKYQLPDRLAGREVRCNQCGNALIIPTPELTSELPTSELSASEPTESTENTGQPMPDSQHKTTQWGNVPAPDGVKNEQSPIVSGWATGPYQKGSSCILTIVLVLIGAGGSFFVGFLAGNLVHNTKPSHFTDQSEIHFTPENFTPENFSPEETNTPEENTAKYTAADWKIDNNSLELFTAQRADGGQIQISLDNNPPVAGEKNKNTLDDIADALGTDEKQPKEQSPKHDQTLRIHSESNTEFRVVWAPQGSIDFDAGKFREIHFSLYLPDKINTAFKPTKPAGIDKILILSNFSLRIVMESGFIEFIPENKDKFVSIIDHAKSDWVSIQIPFSGNEIWKRIDHGIFGSQTHVRSIEFYAQPTGNGATLWIDNLQINK
jgi:hypothetical protein